MFRFRKVSTHPFRVDFSRFTERHYSKGSNNWFYSSMSPRVSTALHQQVLLRLTCGVPTNLCIDRTFQLNVVFETIMPHRQISSIKNSPIKFRMPIHKHMPSTGRAQPFLCSFMFFDQIHCMHPTISISCVDFDTCHIANNIRQNKIWTVYILTIP